ncbi:MAG: Sua5 family C-terminal domain-containing protein, partial [Burkholderiaceae bacterium]
PGQISAEQIADVIGRMPSRPDASAPRASGTLDAHYAPRTPVAVVDANQLRDIFKKLVATGRRVAVMRRSIEVVPDAVGQIKLADLPDGYAHDLYAALRAMDVVNADIILVEAPPTEAQWQGVNDRLGRAAFDSIGILERLGA